MNLTLRLNPLKQRKLQVGRSNTICLDVREQTWGILWFLASKTPTKRGHSKREGGGQGVSR